MKYIVIISNETKTQPTLCDSVGAVYDAINESQYHNNSSWSVWENVNGKAEQCRVLNAYDMRRITIVRALPPF